MAPIDVPRRTRVRWYSDFRDTWLRGFTTTGPAEYIVLQHDPFVDRNVVLHLHVIPHSGTWHDDDILTQVAAFADDGPRQDVTEVPDLGAFANNGTIVDIGGFVGEVIGHGHEERDQ